MNEYYRFAFIFPGQGSQFVGMLSDFFHFDIVRRTFHQASNVLGEDMIDLIMHGPVDKLNQTIYTQPVMLTSSYAIYQLWLDQGGSEPYAVAGHSLGEYTALLVAGVIDFQSAVACVRFRAQVMQDAMPVGIGSMAAILGIDQKTLAHVCQDVSLTHGLVEMVNFNAPQQIVVAGLKLAVEKVCEQAKIFGAKRAIVLPVSAPFHSSLLASAAKKLKQYLSELHFHSPRLLVVQNVNAKYSNDIMDIKNALIQQVDHPVLWVDCIHVLEKLLCKSIVECGPGNVLTGLTRKILPHYVSEKLSQVDDIVRLKSLFQSNK